MNRAIEIINSFRQGMNSMLLDCNPARLRSLRLFNFEKRRVSLYMEVATNTEEFSPMGRIDVFEFPGAGLRSSCSCTMTELQSGKSEQLTLRLQDQGEKRIESLKVFNFFRRVMNLPEMNLDESGLDTPLDSIKDQVVDETEIPIESIQLPVEDEQVDSIPTVSEAGMPENSRGAQEGPATD